VTRIPSNVVVKNFDKAGDPRERSII